MATGAAGRGQNSGRLNYLVIFLLVSLSLRHTKSRLAAPVFSMICRIIALPSPRCNCGGEAPFSTPWCNAECLPVRASTGDCIGQLDDAGDRHEGGQAGQAGQGGDPGKGISAGRAGLRLPGWRLTIPGLPTGGPFGAEKLMYNDEFLATEIGQIGTQFDGPGHIGVLLNAVALRGGVLPVPVAVDPNDPGIVTDKDIEAMIEKQGLDPIAEGDCVFLYTGHGDIWHPTDWDTYDGAEKARRVAQFNAGEPGFGMSACNYLAERKIILWGGDTWATEAVGPGFAGENEQPFQCHIQMMTRHGIWNLENMQFSHLLADNVTEFLFVWSPLKIKGGTGSPGNPVAVY